MHFSSVSEFLAMGGHGLYVWLAYGVFLTVIGFNLVQPLMQGKAKMRALAQRIKRESIES
ncbi:MAG: heme exporter protein CcmD [Hahellaceae bacterium]|nr:heme exporter protein CcmD [Hahellaceae bacterium]